MFFIAKFKACDKKFPSEQDGCGMEYSFRAVVRTMNHIKPIHMKSRSLTTNRSFLAPLCAALALLGGATAHAAYQDVVLANNPVAYYRLEETSGTTAIDGTANHFDTAYATDADTNGVTIWPIMGLPGINTNSLLFRYYVDSSDVPHHGFVNITYHPELSPVTGDGQHGAPFSAECWVLPLTQPANYSIPLAMFGQYETGIYANASGWNFYQSPGPASYWIFNVKNGPFAQASALLIQPLQWYHLAATFDGSTFIFYVNGVARVTTSGVTTYLADHLFSGQIGAGDNTGFLPFTGGVDEVAFYTNVLSATDITNHYQAGITSFSARAFSPFVVEDPASKTVSAGSVAKFTVTADGATPLSYFWLRNGTPISGATTNPLAFTANYPGDNGFNFSVILSNSFSSITSAPATLTVVGTLSIDHQPFSITRTAGTNSMAAFRVDASGALPITYQWYKVVGGTTNIISGATNDTVWISSLQVSDSGSSYFCHATNAFVVTNSDLATLTVNARAVQVALDNYGKIIAADHPVAYWRLDETSGTTAVDASGSFDGTYTSSGSDLTFSYATGIPHASDAAIHITNSAIVTIPYALELNPVTGPWSAEIWLQPTSQDTDFHTPISSEGSVPGHIYGWNFYQHNASAWTLATFNGGVSPVFASDFADIPLTLGKWYHLVVADDLTTLRFYVNNSLVNSVARAGNFVPNGINGDAAVLGGPTTFGVRSDGGFGNWDGGMDEVAFYNYALSPAQVRNHFLNSATLNIASQGNNVVLTWPVGTLQAAGLVTGTFTNVTSATSPYTNAISGSSTYFRLKLQ